MLTPAGGPTSCCGIAAELMAAGEHAIVFISHKLDEVLAIADRITVLRRGKVTAAGDRRGRDHRRADLAEPDGRAVE